MRVAFVVVALAATLLPRIASAQGIVLESYTAKRADDVTALLAPLYEELAARGYLLGDSLGRKYEARVSRPTMTADGLTPDFEAGVERGHKAWINGNFDEAVSILVPLISAAHGNPTAIAQNQPQRDKLLKALIALALAQQRKGDLAAAKETFRELLRGFPDTQLSRAIYGPDAYKLFDEVRRTAGKSGRGRLTIKVPSDQAVVFLNERFENVGNVSKADLLPGEYRVFVQIGKLTSRVHTIMVSADEEAVLAIDSAYDAALRTPAAWTGFAFGSAVDREKLEARYAARFANEVGATAVVVIGIDQVRGRPALVGSLVDIGSGREIRRASLAFDPALSAERLRALARFLGGEDASAELDVEIGAKTLVQPAETQHASSRAWMRWTGVAAIGVGVIGGAGLAWKFKQNASAAGDEIDRVCMITCTNEQVRMLQDDQRAANRNAIISGVTGGALVATGVVFLILSRSHKTTPSVALAPGVHGFDVQFALSF